MGRNNPNTLCYVARLSRKHDRLDIIRVRYGTYISCGNLFSLKSDPKYKLKLLEVAANKLSEIRETGSPVFLLKENGSFYYTYLPRNIDLKYSPHLFFGDHICGRNDVCDRLSPLSEKNGGCSKVFFGSTGIEFYPFILKGYETCNTGNDALHVSECTNYKEPGQKAVYTLA